MDFVFLCIKKNYRSLFIWRRCVFCETGTDTSSVVSSILSSESISLKYFASGTGKVLEMLRHLLLPMYFFLRVYYVKIPKRIFVYLQFI
jgi:hypothetical protein